MNKIITANELKTGGVSAIEKVISEDSEAIITVRGKNRYVVMDIEKYNHLRECELETALAESRHDLKNGRYVEESVEDHIKRITIG